MDSNASLDCTIRYCSHLCSTLTVPKLCSEQISLLDAKKLWKWLPWKRLRKLFIVVDAQLWIMCSLRGVNLDVQDHCRWKPPVYGFLSIAGVRTPFKDVLSGVQCIDLSSVLKVVCHPATCHRQPTAHQFSPSPIPHWYFFAPLGPPSPSLDVPTEHWMPCPAVWMPHLALCGCLT